MTRWSLHAANVQAIHHIRTAVHYVAAKLVRGTPTGTPDGSTRWSTITTGGHDGPRPSTVSNTPAATVAATFSKNRSLRMFHFTGSPNSVNRCTP